MRIGLKLYSTDTALLPEARVLYDNGLFGYIEMYLVPETWHAVSTYWHDCRMPCLVHAAHSAHGVNLADVALRIPNKKVYQEVQEAADILSTPIIIAHSGNNGSLEEVVLQLSGINDLRIHVENKPRKGIKGEWCVGSLPSEIAQILRESPVGGCVLDFGHALCAGITEKIPAKLLLEQFNNLKPILYHLSDGIVAAEVDSHLNLGSGEYDLRLLTSFLLENSSVTLETNRKPGTGLKDFEVDCTYLRRLIS